MSAPSPGDAETNDLDPETGHEDTDAPCTGDAHGEIPVNVSGSAGILVTDPARYGPVYDP